MTGKSHPPRAVQELVNKILDDWGMARLSREQRVFLVWDEALGSTLARTTRPAAVHHGSLIVAVKNSAWLQELQFMKPEIIKKLNRVLGKGVIREVRFKIGSWPDEAPPGKAEEQGGEEGPAELDPAVVEEARAAVAAIADPRLREQVFKTLLASARKDAREQGKE
ncbi:MAG TPA: DUF721 domain-containing protein [bacterium]|nr:DUF721 domain-containing protein [bacterium]